MVVHEGYFLVQHYLEHKSDQRQGAEISFG